MKILKSHKYRLYPSKVQIQKLEQQFGACRWVYNWGLETKIREYEKAKKEISCFDLNKRLTVLKQREETKWLREANSQALQDALRNLDSAFTSFFRKKNRFPKFKSKKSKQSFSVPQHININFETNRLYIGKFNEGIRGFFHREFKGKIKKATISKTCSEKYFVSVLIETSDEYPEKPRPKEDKSIGLDLGLTHFCTLSTGEKIDNPKFLNKLSKKLKREQRRLSKKKKGSKNREKQRLVLSRVYEKIQNQRNDFLHKLSRRLVDEKQVDTICLESLDIKQMLKNHWLSRNISDSSWSIFISMLKYKCDWCGKNILFIGKFEPSSKLCTCGYLNQNLKLQDRKWICPNCGTKHDRDILAANNIKHFAFHKQNLIRTDCTEFTPVETRISKVGSLNQEDPQFIVG